MKGNIMITMKGNIRTKTSTAMARHKKACLELIEAVKCDYPVGSHVYVAINVRSTILLAITDHSDAWWASPGEIIGQNITTSAVHRFYPGQVVE
jgi:hypothetical protein